MSLEKIAEALKASQNKIPPVEQWNPDYCGEIDLEIKQDGSWFYNGTIFKRMSLVKLFASVLKRENNDYFLVTPVEKVKIQVEDYPFLITQWQWLDSEQTVMQLTTNLDDKFILDNEHPVTITDDGLLTVIVRRNLMAKVHRNVYYQWIDLAKETMIDGQKALAFTSQNCQINIGFLE
ncbi:DUF1285 domain-containing protein [Thalassotalea marina]|uniref:DUF1285 domain-containing protein n=1 Tax=Thalassotalea marina TaxID=1673741 RepID=A0A919EJI9_9GAMM|nr:DUF1285 domain-containing protein [Thalassotalea marina]GHF88510.1 hypothetical protein GCM10017161_15310 [Thalassotalea marina]